MRIDSVIKKLKNHKCTKVISEMFLICASNRRTIKGKVYETINEFSLVSMTSLLTVVVDDSSTRPFDRIIMIFNEIFFESVK